MTRERRAGKHLEGCAIDNDRVDDFLSSREARGCDVLSVGGLRR